MSLGDVKNSDRFRSWNPKINLPRRESKAPECAFIPIPPVFRVHQANMSESAHYCTTIPVALYSLLVHRLGHRLIFSFVFGPIISSVFNGLYEQLVINTRRLSISSPSSSTCYRSPSFLSLFHVTVWVHTIQFSFYSFGVVFTLSRLSLSCPTCLLTKSMYISTTQELTLEAKAEVINNKQHMRPKQHSTARLIQ